MSHQDRPGLHPNKKRSATSIMENTIKIIASYALWTRATALFYSSKQGFQAVFAFLVRLVHLSRLAPLTLAAVLAGCSALPDKPVRSTVYDFGPGAVAIQGALRMAPLPAVALEDVQSSAALDSTAVLYRLAYADIQALRPYAQARWSMTPAQLLRQRLREHLGLRRAVLNPGDGNAPGGPVATVASVATGATSPNSTTSPVITPATTPATTSASLPVLLRVELEEFSQLFESPSASTGLLRLRATAMQASPQGEKLLGQRSFIAQRPAPSADAAGGVRALTAAADAVVDEVDQWLQQLR